MSSTPAVITVDSTESEWFKIAALIISALGIVFFGWQTYIYARLKASPVNMLDPGDITSMLVFNIIMLILSIILFSWALYRIFLARKYRQYLEAKAYSGVSGVGGFFTETEYGYNPLAVAPAAPTAGAAAIGAAAGAAAATAAAQQPRVKFDSNQIAAAQQQAAQARANLRAAQAAQASRVPITAPSRTSQMAPSYAVQRPPVASSSRPVFQPPVTSSSRPVFQPTQQVPTFRPPQARSTQPVYQTGQAPPLGFSQTNPAFQPVPVASSRRTVPVP